MTNELTTTESMAQSMLPYYRDGGRKSKYLSYLVAGFSVMEAVRLAKISFKSVQNWRKDDPNFASIEEQSRGELARQLSDQLMDIEFTRNFKLVLGKDFDVLYKDAQGIALTDREQQYLIAIRKFYTPQQLAMLRQILSGGDGSTEAFDFTKTVLTIRLEKEQGTKVV